MKKINFYKINAGGNDFICINNLDHRYSSLMNSEDFPRFLKKLCRRGLSVGTDGVIIAEQSTENADIQARFFEPDGSEVGLCGNGTACFVHWVIEENMVRGPEISIQTRAGITHGRKKESSCSVCIPDPHHYEPGIKLDINDSQWEVDFIVSGTGHAITHVDKLETLDVAHWGKAIRHHNRFDQPVNANFVQVLKEGHIANRTFEFGVEAETLACGTGSASAAILSAMKFNWDRKFLNGTEPVLVDVRGGTTLKVWFNYDADRGNFHDVCMETTPTPIYSGTLHPDFLKEFCTTEHATTTEQAVDVF